MVAFKSIRPKTDIIRPFLSHPTEISVGCALISRNPTVFESKNWKIWTIIQMVSQTVNHLNEWQICGETGAYWDSMRAEKRVQIKHFGSVSLSVSESRSLKPADLR